MQRSADKDTESPDSSVSSFFGQTTDSVFFFGKFKQKRDKDRTRAVQYADACLKEASDPSKFSANCWRYVENAISVLGRL